MFPFILSCHSSRSTCNRPPYSSSLYSSCFQVFVKVSNIETGLEFEWTKEKFLDRLYLMKEMYQNYESGDKWDLPLEKDPFYDDPDIECLIGTAQVFLQPLAYLIEVKEQLDLIDYKRTEVGIISVEIAPCTPDGKEHNDQEDLFVDSPSELVGKDVHFLFKIYGCRGLPARFTVSVFFLILLVDPYF